MVLHEDAARVDVYDADAVAAAGGHPGCGPFRRVRVRLEHHVPDRGVDVGGVVVLAVRTDEVHGVVGEAARGRGRVACLLRRQPNYVHII